MSSASSPKSESTAGTSVGPIPGVLWVTTSIMAKSLPPSIIHDWYDEHLQDVLNCPGQGGLALRYKNVDSSISDYADPGLAARFAPSAPANAVAQSAWPYLALLKLSDLAWLTSKQFDNMPRVSKLLPPQEDGSMGSAFDALHAGLRSYETVVKKEGKSTSVGRPRFILSLQTTEAGSEALGKLYELYSGSEDFRGLVSYKHVPGLLQYQEPGALPDGLVLFEFDGERAPKLEGDKHADMVVRGDVWELIAERGDLSLGL